MSKGKQNPALQRAYLSENTPKGNYYSVLISFADYDTGHIEGKWGKNQAPTSPLGASGYHRLDASDESCVRLTFDENESCILLSINQEYKKLSGELYNKQDGSKAHVVFNQS